MTVLDLVPDLDTKEQRRRERELRRMEEASGPMEPELRYRVLMAVLKMETDFLDLAEHPRDEARRPGNIRSLRTIPFAAIACVHSQ